MLSIAVYSGSFNPLHIGHLAIMKHMTEVAGFDCVYLIVSPKNPLKESISSATGKERYDAAVQAVARHPELKVKVDGIELDWLRYPSVLPKEKRGDHTIINDYMRRIRALLDGFDPDLGLAVRL